jgi:hypothetical protein
MTTAIKLAEEMYAEDYAPAGKLIAIIDERIQEVAELREKERECQTQQQTQSRPQSVSSESASSSLQSSARASEASETEWRPNSTDVANALATVTNIGHPGSTYSAHQYIRAGLILGHRIAMEKCKCSNTPCPEPSSPASSGPVTTSVEGADTRPDTPTESSTPSPKSGASSLDERAEALFAAHPEWRPVVGFRYGVPVKIQLIRGLWAADGASAYSQEIARNYVLAAILPRAIAKWEHKYYLVGDSRKSGVRIYNALEHPPRDLESAISALEGK